MRLSLDKDDSVGSTAGLQSVDKETPQRDAVTN